MSDKFSEQKDALLSIKHEISLLHQQVDFLLRNEKEVGLLDLDVMMNRTHSIYDKMCSIDIGGYSTEAFEEEEPVAEKEEPNNEEETRHCEEASARNDEVEEEEPAHEEEEPVVEEEEPVVEEEEPVVEEEEPVVEEEEPAVEENEDAYFEEEVEEEDAADDLGFILNFEPTEDHSLAAKLQHESINDLRAAIGINDKFLLVNELFGGSMEKYNKSIDNLNDLKTLNGALVYMNELRIELQWNSNNEAYKKLLDLVHRKFE